MPGEEDEAEPIVRAYFESLEERSNFDVAPSTPLRLLVRSVALIRTQAALYYREGDLQMAYILYLRFCKLGLLQLPKLAESAAPTAETADLKALSALKQQIRPALLELERIKPALMVAVREHYATERQRRRDEQHRSAAEHRQQIMRRIETSREALDRARRSQRPGGAEDEAKALEAEDDDDGCMIKFDLPIMDAQRRLVIPQALIEIFAKVAEENTARNVETCGVLAGTLRGPALHVTAVIVPKQSGTDDTCQMTHEEELVEVQDRQGLLTLGWIHTHPSQACFLSSVDVHTQFGFQALLKEAVAIVLAPSQSPAWGAFRLTDLDVIAQCPRRGFHCHDRPDGQIYRSVAHDITWISSGKIEDNIKIIDLR
jgi:proteasome lid subunit RPN8/RPN11